jgi:hypothetical protein
MTNWTENPPSRRLACSACGTVFTCSPQGGCWCAEEDVRLPMPVAGQDFEDQDFEDQDCLCRDCLRKAAEQPESKTAS